MFEELPSWVMMGAIWQQEVKHMSLAEEVADLRGKLELAESKLAAIAG